MGYSGETNDINFSSGTTAFYDFLGFLINGESTNGAGLSESNVQMPFSPGSISLLYCDGGGMQRQQMIPGYDLAWTTVL
jgi:hypothetical protein